MKGEPKPNEANHNAVRWLARSPIIKMRDITVLTCPNCGKAKVTIIVNSVYQRCEPCANHLITLWNEVRCNLDGQDS